MFRQIMWVLMTLGLASACWARDIEDMSAPNVVTPYVESVLNKHIEQATVDGGGYFRFYQYLFRPVRIHTEYLWRLGPSRYFACVDLVDVSGDVYDLDLYLTGPAGSMRVDRTTVHKCNGIPFYAWKQNAEGFWERVPLKDATPDLLGVIEGRDEFDFLYRIRIPEISDTARMWVPYPLSDAFQQVELKSIEPLLDYRVLEDGEYGNKAFYFELKPGDSGKTLDILYHVKRVEKEAYSPLSGSDGPQKALEPDRLVPIDGRFKNKAAEAVRGREGDVERARAIYDHVIDHVRYTEYGEGWGRGDAVRAYEAGTGDSTDFHSYFIALARSAGIAARFAAGAAIPSERKDGATDGYHSWAEFYAGGNWHPVDVSEADNNPDLADYYFGHNPANRIELSRGRDLAFDPGPGSGPINYFVYPVLESDGKVSEVDTVFFFTRNF